MNPARRIFIANLPYDLDRRRLQQWLADQGFATVEVVLPLHARTGTSRGIAFAELAEDEVARAIEVLHGEDCYGRPAIVRLAEPRQPRAADTMLPDRARRHRRQGGRQPSERRILRGT